MTTERPSDELMARVLSGNPHLGDAEAVAAWVGTDPLRRAEVERLESAWMRPPSDGWDIDRAWDRVVRDVATDLTSTQAAPVTNNAMSTWARHGVAWRIAAGLVITVGLAGAWLTLRPDNVAPAERYATAAGERREITLSDGSVVVLAPRSTLVVASGFGADSRTLTLDGEAWFSAAHQANAPLVVETASHIVRDIGTVFTVWARDGREVRVAVVEGEVAVRGRAATAGGEQRLVAGDVARFAGDMAGPTSLTSKQPVDTIASWRDGTLDVIAEPAGRVLAQLGTWYGVRLTLADTRLNTQAITAALSLDSLDGALEVVALLLDVTAERTANGIVLRPRL